MIPTTLPKNTNSMISLKFQAKKKTETHLKEKNLIRKMEQLPLKDLKIPGSLQLLLFKFTTVNLCFPLRLSHLPHSLSPFLDQPVYSVDFLEGTEILASGAGDDRALLIDARQLDVLADLGSAADSITSVRFCSVNDQALLATASMDGLVRIYASDPTQGIVLKEVLDAGEEAECCWINWHPRGSVLIAGFGSGSIWMWKVSFTAAAQVMAVFASPISGVPVTCGQFTPDGKGVIAGAADGSVYLLSPKAQLSCLARHTPAPHHTLPLGECSSLAMHPQSPLLMVGDIQGHVKVFKLPVIEDSIQPQQQQQQLPVPLIELSHGHVEGQSIESCAFHPTGTFALSAGMDGRVLFYDAAASYNTRCQFALNEALAVESEDLSALLSGEGVVLTRWMASFANGLALPTEFQFSVLVGSSLGRLCLVDGRTGRVQRRFKGRLGVPVLDASVSAGGILAVAFDDGSISEYQL